MRKQAEYRDEVLHALYLIQKQLEIINNQNDRIIEAVETISEVNADAHGYKLKAYNTWSRL